MSPGSKGRNFESFSGLLIVGKEPQETGGGEKLIEAESPTAKPMKVLDKLYKKQ